MNAERGLLGPQNEAILKGAVEQAFAEEKPTMSPQANQANLDTLYERSVQKRWQAGYVRLFIRGARNFIEDRLPKRR